MFEALRKLTADYTEAEYEAWLMEDCLADIPKGKNEFTIPTISEDADFDDLGEAFAIVEEDTGYDAGFLYEVFCECLEDGQTKTEAFDHVAGVSYEQDW